MTSLSRVGEGNGNSLQCSFLENPRDGGAWWAAVYGVAQSRTRLKRLGSSYYVVTLKRQLATKIRLRWAYGTSLVAQLVKNPPAMQETLVQFLGEEDPLEKETATHSSILAWESLWTEEPGGLHVMGSQRVRHD